MKESWGSSRGWSRISIGVYGRGNSFHFSSLPTYPYSCSSLATIILEPHYEYRMELSKREADGTANRHNENERLHAHKTTKAINNHDKDQVKWNSIVTRVGPACWEISWRTPCWHYGGGGSCQQFLGGPLSCQFNPDGNHIIILKNVT